MHFVKIKNKQDKFEVEWVKRVSEHVIEIAFHDTIPNEFGDIRIFTENGVQYSNLPGYDTIFRDEGQTVYLSDDGSVYAPEVNTDPVVPPEPFIPTIAELKASKKKEINTYCEQVIYSGVSVMLEDGSTEHFSLTAHDQMNLFGKQAQLSAGADQLEYHADGHPCRYYSAADMQAIINAAMWHVSYHTTYCNAINMWIAGCQSAEEVQVIFYGADVPDAYKSEVLKAYILQTAAMPEDDADDTPVTE